LNIFLISKGWLAFAKISKEHIISFLYRYLKLKIKKKKRKRKRKQIPLTSCSLIHFTLTHYILKNYSLHHRPTKKFKSNKITKVFSCILYWKSTSMINNFFFIIDWQYSLFEVNFPILLNPNQTKKNVFCNWVIAWFHGLVWLSLLVQRYSNLAWVSS